MRSLRGSCVTLWLTEVEFELQLRFSNYRKLWISYWRGSGSIVTLLNLPPVDHSGSIDPFPEARNHQWTADDPAPRSH